MGRIRTCSRLASAVLLGIVATSLISLLGVFAASIPAAAAAGNLIKNGSFEKPVVGPGSYLGFSTGQTFKHWTVIGANGNVAVVSGTFTQNGFSFPAEKGKQWLDLTGVSNTPTGVQETVETTAGASYKLTFWIGNVYDPGGIFGTTSTVKVLIDGSNVASDTNSQQGTTQVWQKFTVHFMAASTNTQVGLLNGDPSNDTNNGLDAVSLTRS
jgi:Protein of unknown function (DUF642)